MVRVRKAGSAHRQSLIERRIEDIKGERNRILHILELGTLAPSTHNTQPWLFSIDGSHVSLRANFDKHIPEADPAGRDMYISLGALLWNIKLVAKEYGVGLTVEHPLSKQLKPELVANLRFDKVAASKQPNSSTILNAVINRQNYRGFFSRKHGLNAAKKVVNQLENHGRAKAYVVTDERQIGVLADLTALGVRMAYADRAFREEISRHINHNLSRKKTGLHGFSLRMNLPLSLVLPKVIKRKDMGAKLAKINHASFVTAPVVVVLTNREGWRNWLETGELLEDLLLKLTENGLHGSIYAAAIEMGNLRSEVGKSIGIKGDEVAQLIVCVGAPTIPLPFSIRKQIRSVLK